MPSCLRHLLHALHGVVEVAGDLHGQGAVVERLGQFAVGDLAAADEDDGRASVRSRSRRRRAKRWCCRCWRRPPAAPDHAGVGERGGHAVVLEAAGRVHALVLQEQLARSHADIAGHGVGALQDGLAFADGQDVFGRGERQQFAEAPDAAEAERIGAFGPFGLEFAQRLRRLSAGPSRRRHRASRRSADRQTRCRPRPQVAAQSGLIQRW